MTRPVAIKTRLDRQHQDTGAPCSHGLTICIVIVCPWCQLGQSPASASASPMQVSQLCWEEPLPGGPWRLDSGVSFSVFLGRCLTRHGDPHSRGSFTVLVRGWCPTPAYPNKVVWLKLFALMTKRETQDHCGATVLRATPLGLHPVREHGVRCGA